MDKISIWSMLFVSFPEELLMVLITLAAVGYRDALNFKNRDNMLKLLISTTLMVLSATIIGLFFDISLKFILNTVVFFIIIVFVYRYKPLYCIFGFLLSTIVIIVSEIVFVPLFISLFKMSFQQISSSTLYSFLFFLPDRIMQLITLIIICKTKKISLAVDKILPSDISIIVMYFLTIMSNALFFEDKFVVSQTLDLVTKIKFITSTTIGIVFSLWLIAYLFKLRQKIFLKENIHDVELHHIRQLISEGEFEHAVQLIDSTLNERGYYSKQ